VGLIYVSYKRTANNFFNESSMKPQLFAAIPFMFLAACGGGGGSGSGNAPPNTSNAPSPVKSFTNLQGSETVPLFTAAVGSNMSSIAVTEASNSATATISPVTVNGVRTISANFNVNRDGIRFQQNITPDDYDGKTWVSDDFGAASKAVNGRGTILGFHEPSDPAKQLSYVQFGAWADTNLSNATDTTAGGFAGGFETVAGSVPKSGTATYTGTTFGIAATSVNTNTPRTYEIAGRTTLTADFSKQTIAGTFDQMKGVELRTDGSHGSVVAMDGLNFTSSAAINSSRFAGTTGNTAMSGQIKGAFYGPNAEVPVHLPCLDGVARGIRLAT
jgi:hypothetical protein